MKSKSIIWGVVSVIAIIASTVFIASGQGGSVTGASPKTPWLYYPQKEFFYSNFCRKYRCLDNGGESKPGFSIEYQGIGDANYTGFFGLKINRSRVGTNQMWPEGVSLLIKTNIRYSDSTARTKDNFLDSDTYNFISDLSEELIGKKYPKQQLIRCLRTRNKSVGLYFLDEFLTIPTNFPRSKVSSRASMPFYVNVYCSTDNKGYTIDFSVQP